MRALEQGDTGLQNQAASLGPLETPALLPPSTQPLAEHGSQPMPAFLPFGDALQDEDTARSYLCSGSYWLVCCNVIRKLRQRWCGGSFCLLGSTASLSHSTLSLQVPLGFFSLIQFFRAFSKKAEDGIRITSEYSEPSFGGLFCFVFSLGANGSDVHTPHALGPQGAQRAAKSSSLSSAQPMGPASQ